MSFATALSGLKAASTSLQVTGNNIANSQTTGFKQSRAEFADVYASSLGGVSKTQAGSGVRVAEVSQQFSDGNIEATQNSLDLAINGNGFFVLADKVSLPDPKNPEAPVDPSVPSAYSRSGAFKLNSAGNVVNSKGQYVLAFAPNGTTAEEGFSVGVFHPLTVDTSQGLPKSTTGISLKLNLDGSANVPTTATFDPNDPTSYTSTTSVTTYDSQGNSHIASTYYVKTPVANVWDVFLFMDNHGITSGGQAVPPLAANPSTVKDLYIPGVPIKMAFNNSGLLSGIGDAATSSMANSLVSLASVAVTKATTASTSALAAQTATGTDATKNATAVSDASTASANASSMYDTLNSIVNSSSDATVSAALTAAVAAAKTARDSAATYLSDATKIVDQPTADTAATSAATALTDMTTAQLAVQNYYNLAKSVADKAIPTTTVDFGSIDLTKIDPNITVDPMAFSVGYSGTTQFNVPYSVNGSSQDGLPAGNLTGIDVNDTGMVFAKYSNGGSKALGQVALARFPNNQGLSKLGDTNWGKTAGSGTAIYGAAGDNNFGGIQASALEGSNVDLSDQLVKLIVQQQAYQANSQTITTEKTLIDTILRA